jgi:hypothetical protein
VFEELRTQIVFQLAHSHGNTRLAKVNLLTRTREVQMLGDA